MKVSIITVTYNSANTLADTIQSVLAQTYRDIEYIIIDGGSKDSTLDIVRQYESDFEGRLKWISESDKGIYDAMNKGIRLATGDVVGILNSDDFYTSPNVVNQLVRYFDNSDIDAVYGDIHFVNSNCLEKCVRYYSSRRFHPRWLRFGFMPAHPSFYLKKEIYDKVGGYKLDYKIGSDYEMMVRLFHCYKIKSTYIPMDFVTMRTGGASTKDINSRITLVKEDVRACRENNMYTNSFMISLKFLYKIFEIKWF